MFVDDDEADYLLAWDLLSESKGRKIEIEWAKSYFDTRHAGEIFQPFVRLHEMSRVDGSGSGLAICRKIVERRGGTITASSTPGKGSVFSVTLSLQQMRRVSQSIEAGVPPRDSISSIPSGIK